MSRPALFGTFQVEKKNRKSMPVPTPEPEPGPEPETVPETKLVFLTRERTLVSGDETEPAVQAQTISTMQTITSSIADKHPVEKPKIKWHHQISIDNFEREQSNMAATTLFLPTGGFANLDIQEHVTDATVNDGTRMAGMDGNMAYKANMQTLLSWQSGLFDLDDYIGKLSDILRSAAELTDLKNTAEEKVDKNCRRQAEIRQNIATMFDKVPSKVVRKLKQDGQFEMQPLGKLIALAEQQMTNHLVQQSIANKNISYEDEVGLIVERTLADERDHYGREAVLKAVKLQCWLDENKPAEPLEERDTGLSGLVADMPLDMVRSQLKSQGRNTTGDQYAVRYRLLHTAQVLPFSTSWTTTVKADIEHEIKLAQRESKIAAIGEHGQKLLVFGIPKAVAKELLVSVYSIAKNKIEHMDLHDVHTHLLDVARKAIDKEIQRVEGHNDGRTQLEKDLIKQLDERNKEREPAARKKQQAKQAVSDYIETMSIASMELALSELVASIAKSNPADAAVGSDSAPQLVVEPRADDFERSAGSVLDALLQMGYTEYAAQRALQQDL
jgi:hypothetical protein